MNLEAVLNEVGSWPVKDRLRLIEEVWGTISASPEVFDLTDPQKHDLRRRLEAYRDNPQVGSSWEEVEARLREPSL